MTPVDPEVSMAHGRFDAWSEAVAAATASRRGLMRALLGGTLGVLLGHGGLTGIAAKKKKKRGNKKKTSPPPPPPGDPASPIEPPPPECIPSCEKKLCGEDGCGGSCGTCSAGQVCQIGQCLSK
jgi:hypothetical protein